VSKKKHLSIHQMPAQCHSSQPTARVPHPYLRCNQNLHNTFKDKENDLIQRVRSVIDHMRSQGLNLAKLALPEAVKENYSNVEHPEPQDLPNGESA
jgi:hypothetical protein